jgi:hypothetical protein
MPIGLISERRTNSKLRITLRILALIVFACCILYLAAWSYSLSLARKARDLIGHAERLGIGVTTEEEVRGFSADHGGKFESYDQSAISGPDEAEATTSIQVFSPRVTIHGRDFHLPGFAQRGWGVLVTLGLRDGHLVRAMFGIAVGRSDGEVLEAQTTLGGPNFAQSRGGPYHVYDAHISGGPPGEALDVAMGPQATEIERKHGLDFNLKCLTRLRECRHACELMPSAWKDLPLDRRMHYADHHELLIDAECRHALGSQ